MPPAEQLIERVRRKDWTVVPDVKHATEPVASGLARLAGAEDRRVRELALVCLDEIGGAQARGAFLQALYDPAENIRDRGVGFLHHHHAPADLPALYRALAESPDLFVREQVALIIGEIGDGAAIPELKRQLQDATASGLRAHLELALARLGDRDSQERVLGRLERPGIPERKEGLRDFEYMNEPAHAARLLPLLDDRREADVVVPEPVPLVLRVCDLAVLTVERVLRRPLPFPTDAPRQFSDEELHRAREILRRLPA
jgi:HEAT repeat protein